jgi:hypothetical protein
MVSEIFDYFYVVSSKNYLIDQQPIEEVLREKSVYYSLNNKARDFWILPFPNNKIKLNILKQINNENCSLEEKLLKIKNIRNNEFITIISTNSKFINWLKLRFTNVLKGKYSFKV